MWGWFTNDQTGTPTPSEAVESQEKPDWTECPECGAPMDDKGGRGLPWCPVCMDADYNVPW